jgi:hypothetical protein
MGAFNKYEIQQLKLKFNHLDSDHKMLVRITNQHDEDIKNLSDNVQAIIELIHLLAECNPGLLMVQIGEMLDKLKDRVKVLVNAVHQLHHRRLAIGLLTPGYIAILLQSVQ